MKKYIAEFIGTFGLVFCGTGAIIVNEQTHGTITYPGIAMVFGLIVLVMIYTFGNTSGAHFNPAVTIGFFVAKLFPAKQVPFYIVSQISGALIATAVLKFLFPENQNLGSTIPAGSAMQSFALEYILTYFLMIVIINVSHGAKETGILAGIAIGCTVLLGAMFAGAISGASMNPARSIAPAIFSGNMRPLWIYILAPVSGAVSATLTWMWMEKN